MIERSRLKRWLSDPSLSEHLHSQLGFLDAYERLLDRGVADGAEINEVIRAGFEAFLSLAQSRRWDRPEVNDLMKAELALHLGREPYERKPQSRNHRNGYRSRRVTVKGLGTLDLRVPRDREGGFQKIGRAHV